MAAFPWMQAIKGGGEFLGGQQNNSSGGKGGGKGGGVFATLGQRSNAPKQAITGLATGAVQQIQASKLKKRAESAFPELVDPNQASYLAELNQKRRSIETGADFAAGMQAADTTQASTNDAIVQSSGGDVGGTLQALLQGQRVAGDTKNKVLSEGQQQQFGYDNAYGNMLNQISARKLQLQLLRSNQARAEWAAKQKSASQNLQAGIAGLNENSQNYSQPDLSGSANGAAPAPASNFPTDWSFAGKQEPNLSGKPKIENIETKGVESPKVVPEKNLATQGLGTVFKLGGK